MSDGDRLLRRLMICYPRDYRRERGEDLLATMVQAAGGRTRPTAREALNLVAHGLRARIGRPASRTVVAWVLVAAVIGGLYAGSFGAWRTTYAGPGAPAGQVLIEESVPGVEISAVDTRDDRTLLGWVPPVSTADRRPMAALTVRTDLDSLAAGLRADGWTVRSSETVLATRDGLALTATRTGTDGVTDVRIDAATAWLAWPAGIASGLLGGVLAFLAVAWAARRTGPGHPMRVVVNVFFGIAMAVWWAPVLAGVSRRFGGEAWIARVFQDWPSPPEAAMLGVVGAAAALGGLALATIPPRAEQRRAGA
ncbi:hypothetical protein [Catenuloplanes atrovinosus]|uniref:Uncharacterized protein n=1 Tax=Catenuloplanes atrovinosus TaxID=137266 RepID=A0AAE4C846_9ACTN|nr:hypothetical protein [Catenuloplanes atrovinosus]MDR7274603.1 hypothetical protein [Catenuloplanes atrovinosus]